MQHRLPVLLFLLQAAAALRFLPLRQQRPLGTIVFIRHGDTAWNEKPERFTGWADPDISTRGANQAASAALALKESGFTFDVVYTSVLKRAVHTTWLVLKELEQVHSHSATSHLRGRRLARGSKGGHRNPRLASSGGWIGVAALTQPLPCDRCTLAQRYIAL